MTAAHTVLVTGATGSVGSAVVRNLRRRGVPTRALVRDPIRANAVLGNGVELAVGDLSSRDSVRGALAGVQQVLLCTPNHPDQVRREMRVIDAAADSDVQRVVKIGALGTQEHSRLQFWDAHARIERHLHASGLQAVVLQPSMYMTILIATAETIRRTGRLYAPAAAARIALIDPRDVAAVATVALTEDGHAGNTYALTGRIALTHHDIAEQITSATGRPVEYVEVPDAAARETMAAAGMPDWLVQQIIALWGELRAGAHDTTTDAVRVLTGRDPRSVADFARDHARLFETATGGQRLCLPKPPTMH